MNQSAQALLLDHRASRTQRWVAYGFAVCLIGLTLGLTPLASTQLPQVSGFFPSFGAAMVTVNLLIAALQFSRGVTERNNDAALVGGAYGFVGLIFVPLLAVFPGAYVPGSLIGTTRSAVWLWVFWHQGFGILICAYCVRQFGSNLQPVRRTAALFGVVALVAVCTVFSTVGIDWLPPVMVDGKTFFSGAARDVPTVCMLTYILGIGMLLKLLERRPEHLWMCVGLLAALCEVWLTVHGATRWSLAWYVSKLLSLSASVAVLCAVALDITQLYRKVTAANQLLSALANQDGLTGIANRRRLDEFLNEQWRTAQLNERNLSVLMVDVDHFKRFNDTFGHLAGDETLKGLAAVLRNRATKSGGLAARYGGEEFCLILPNCSSDAALAVAHGLEQDLREANLAYDGNPTGLVTVSIGVASILPGETNRIAELVLAADAALYQAKACGRNRIELAPALLKLAA